MLKSMRVPGILVILFFIIFLPCCYPVLGTGDKIQSSNKMNNDSNDCNVKECIIFSTPKGPRWCKTNTMYGYRIVSWHHSEKLLWYQWDFDDNQDQKWMGPVHSGENAYGNHMWVNAGIYQVRCRFKDADGWVSPWSETLTVYVHPCLSAIVQVLEYC